MIRTDSRQIGPGDTFIALDGLSSRGSEYIGQALSKGAVRIVCTEADLRAGRWSRQDAQFDLVPDTRAYMEDLLKETYGETLRQMCLIGVTGTNGKTTTCYLLWQMLNRLGTKCAYIGTVGFYLEEKVRALPNTSVDLCDFYNLLIEAHEAGYDHVVMEASSQGLAMGRFHTVMFDRAVFTNLTEDHLDYHKTMENYALAKQELFRSLKPGGAALVNGDDPYAGCFLLEGKKNYTFGFSKGCDFYINDCQHEEFTFALAGREYRVATSLPGRYNIYNLMAACGVLISLGIDPEKILALTPDLVPPEGRVEVIPYGTCRIVVDYAHTPDAVEQILNTAEEYGCRHIYTVFGCTGEREREKRPVMTGIVLSRSERAVITVDDPHGEDPSQIFADMLTGCDRDNYEICPDRKEAIRRGIGMLSDHDTLLILGKGHERFIVFGDRKIPHNDKEEVLKILAEQGQ